MQRHAQRRLMSVFLPLLFLLFRCFIVRADFSNRITNGRLFEFRFEEGQLEDAPSLARDAESLNLLGSIELNTAACSLLADHPGLLLPGSASQLSGQSQQTIAVMLDRIETARAFTLEAWFTPRDLQQTSMIVGFGQWTTPPRQSPGCYVDQLTFELHQDGGMVGGQQAQGTANAKACSKVEDFVDTPAPTHVIITYAVNGTAFIFLNGQYNGQHSSNLRTWYPYWIQSHRLFLTPDLDATRGDSTWAGELHLLAMYDRVLTNGEITAQFSAGIPPARPQPVQRLQRLVGYQDTPSSYSLQLNATDFDSPPETLSLYLMSAPATGTLSMRLQGAPARTITSAMLPCLVDVADLNGVVYTPAAGGSGVGAANFTWTAHDEYNFGRVATVVFDIIPLPIPRNDTTQVFLGVAHDVSLLAANVDEYEVWITALPQFGALYQVGNNASRTALTAASLPIRVTNSSHRVTYLPTRAASGSATCFYDDAVAFSIALANGMRSQLAGQLTLRVCNPLSARSSNITMAPFAAVTWQLDGSSRRPGDNASFFVLLTMPNIGGIFSVPFGVQLRVNDTVPLGSSVSYRRTINPTTGGVSFAADAFNFLLSNGAGLQSSVATVMLTTQPSPFDSRSTTGLQCLYLFGEGEAGDPFVTTLQDTSAVRLGGLLNLPSVGTSWLNNSAGIVFSKSIDANSSLAVQSASPVDALYASLHGASNLSPLFSLEVWFEIDLAVLSTGMIFGVGSRSASTGAMSYDVSLHQEGQQIYARVGASTQFSWTESVPLDGSFGIVRRHVVWSCNNVVCTLLVDNVVKGTVASSSLSDPAGKDMRLVMGEGLSAGSQGYSKWRGTLYLVALYNRMLTYADIEKNFLAGLPTPRPRVQPAAQTVNVLEYSTGSLALQVSFAARAFNASTTGSAAVVDPTANLDYYISSLPVFGSLLLLSDSSAVQSSSPLSASQLPFLFFPSVTRFGYVPPAGHFFGREADAFEWTVSDGRAFSAASGAVKVTVEQVVTPPLSLPLAVDGFEITPIRVNLQGTDVDANSPTDSPMSAFWLDSLPSRGTLYSGSLGGAGAAAIDLRAPFLANQITLPFRVASSVSLWYVSSLASTALGSTGGAASDSLGQADSFSFRAEVKATASNFSADVSISLRNHLFAQPLSLTLPQPAMDSSVTRAAVVLDAGVRPSSGPNSYQSNSTEQVVFLVLQLPRYGNLTTSAGAMLCGPASVAPCSLSTNSFIYSRDWNVFASGETDSFVYASSSTLLGGAGGTTPFVFRSVATTVSIAVAPPRVPPSFDPTHLSLPAQPVAPYSSASFNFSLRLTNPSNESLTVPDVSTGKLPQAYKVRMSVTPDTAAFSLPAVGNPSWAERVSFVIGDGVRANIVLVFFAPDIPTLNALFNEMAFQPLYVGAYNVTVEITSGSTTDAPAVAVVEWGVTDGPGSGAGSSSGFGGFLGWFQGSNLVWVWIALGGLVFLCLGGVALRKYLARRRVQAKKKAREERQAQKSAKAEQGDANNQRLLQAMVELTTTVAHSNVLSQSTPLPVGPSISSAGFSSGVEGNPRAHSRLMHSMPAQHRRGHRGDTNSSSSALLAPISAAGGGVALSSTAPARSGADTDVGDLPRAFQRLLDALFDANNSPALMVAYRTKCSADWKRFFSDEVEALNSLVDDGAQPQPTASVHRLPFPHSLHKFVTKRRAPLTVEALVNAYVERSVAERADLFARHGLDARKPLRYDPDRMELVLSGSMLVALALPPSASSHHVQPQQQQQLSAQEQQQYISPSRLTASAPSSGRSRRPARLVSASPPLPDQRWGGRTDVARAAPASAPRVGSSSSSCSRGPPSASMSASASSSAFSRPSPARAGALAPIRLASRFDGAAPALGSAQQPAAFVASSSRGFMPSTGPMRPVAPPVAGNSAFARSYGVRGVPVRRAESPPPPPPPMEDDVPPPPPPPPAAKTRGVRLGAHVVAPPTTTDDDEWHQSGDENNSEGAAEDDAEQETWQQHQRHASASLSSAASSSGGGLDADGVQLMEYQQHTQQYRSHPHHPPGGIFASAGGGLDDEYEYSLSREEEEGEFSAAPGAYERSAVNSASEGEHR
jgi:hypothetical protein